MDEKKRYFIQLFVFFIGITQFGQIEGSEAFQYGTAYCKNRVCTFQPHVLHWSNGTAVGTLNDTLMTTGWSILDITAGANAKKTNASNDDIMFAAGFAEGVLTARKMESQFTNVFNSFFPPPVPKDMIAKIREWFINQRKWIDHMIQSSDPPTPFWRHVGYIMTQFDGLYAGYKSVRGDRPNALDEFAVNFLNANGDMFDLPKAINKSYIPDWKHFTPEDAREYFYTSGHCSGLIKLLPGFENMFISHSTWNTYQATNRIYKHYDLRVDDPDTAAHKMSFPSYPGYLESLDDLYVMNSGLVVMETTNQIFNEKLYDKITVDTLFAWQRVRVANMMANNGSFWAKTFGRYNSGTYNNQYMALDLKKFKRKTPLPDGTLWVTEQIPGQMVSGDQTDILRAGYWPSYNIPFYEEIYNKSGFPAYVAAHGTEFSYQLAPRAKIFRRDQSSVTDMDTMKKLMRYNDYKHDPYSGGSPYGAICSRGDLDEKKPRAFGCYDSKVFDFAMGKDLKANIISGPTLGAGFDPFSWTGPFAKNSHVDLPKVYHFNFTETQPRWKSLITSSFK